MARDNDVKHRRIYEKFYNKKIRKGCHIHHVDGNHTNNDPVNLIEVTAKEHYEIHKRQQDWSSCVLLSKAANISADELYEIQRNHGLDCVSRQIGIHSNDFDHSLNSKKIWKSSQPGRKPVTDGTSVKKFKSEEDIDIFLMNNQGWRRGIPDSMKHGLKQSTRRMTSEESKLLSLNRLQNNNHNFTKLYECPYCKKQGKGPMMKRWHFENCKDK